MHLTRKQDRRIDLYFNFCSPGMSSFVAARCSIEPISLLKREIILFDCSDSIDFFGRLSETDTVYTNYFVNK